MIAEWLAQHASVSSGQNMPFSLGLGEDFVACRWSRTSPAPSRLFAPSVVTLARQKSSSSARGPSAASCLSLNLSSCDRLCAEGSSCRVKMKTNKGQSCQKWLVVGLSRIRESSQHFPWLFLFHPSGQLVVLYSGLLCLNFLKTKKSRNKLFLPPAPNLYQQDHSLCKTQFH